MAAYHEAAGVRSLVLALSLLELIASSPPSRPRFGTIHGGFQQIATTAIVPFNPGLWQHSSQAAPDSEESSFRPEGMVRTLCRRRVFVHSIRRMSDERLLRRSFARSRQLQQPRAQFRRAVAQRFRLCWLGGLGKPGSRQH